MRPLQRVWVGRKASDASAWRETLEGLGYAVTCLPLIQSRSLDPVNPPVNELGDWLFFASPRAVDFFIQHYGADAIEESIPSKQIAAMGPVTAEAVHQNNWSCQLIGHAGGESLALDFLQYDLSRDLQLTFITAKQGRRELVVGLQSAGYRVNVIELYENIVLEGASPVTGETVLLFSPSAAGSLAQRVCDCSQHPVWAIGDTTANAAKQLGFNVTHVLSRPEPSALHDLST